LPQRFHWLENKTATLPLDRQSAQSGTQPIELRGFNLTFRFAGNTNSALKRVSSQPLRGWPLKMSPLEQAIHDTLHHGSPEEVLNLKCPICSGPLKIQYCETKSGSRHIRVSSDSPEFLLRMSGLPFRPKWVDELGDQIVTTP
jgi:hypothetical protein